MHKLIFSASYKAASEARLAGNGPLHWQEGQRSVRLCMTRPKETSRRRRHFVAILGNMVDITRGPRLVATPSAGSENQFMHGQGH